MLSVIGSTLAQFPLAHVFGVVVLEQIEPDSSTMMHTSSFWPTQVGAAVLGCGVGIGVEWLAVLVVCLLVISARDQAFIGTLVHLR